MSGADVGDCVDGRYELRRRLGASEMCVAFEGAHRYTGRSVVVKFPRAVGRTADRSVERLLADARTLGHLRHAHLAELLDAGLTPDSPYVVTDFLGGRSLEGLLTARGTLRPDEAATLGRQVALALDALHLKGLRHGDVSPANVWMVRSPLGDERVVLRNLQWTFEPFERLDVAGVRPLDSPARRSPDSDYGRLAGPEGDLSGLGAVLFECLAGRPPSARPGAPEPPLRASCPDLPAALAAVVDRCLRRAPAGGGARAADLVGDLEATGLDRANARLLGDLRQDLQTAAPSPRGASPLSRRRVPRAPYHTPVRLLGHHGFLDGAIEDISTRGVLVIAARALEVAAVVRLHFALPDTGAMEWCTAVLRWVRIAPSSKRAAMGFEFQAPPMSLRSAVEGYVARRGGDADGRGPQPERRQGPGGEPG